MKLEELQNKYGKMNKEEVIKKWEEVYAAFNHKIIVLDDDPTGVQTVHGVSVYTDWTEAIIEQGFLEENKLFFILTNSRALTASETEHVHCKIAERIETASKKHQMPYLLISRSDSTLRGHYPLETSILKETIEKNSQMNIDGEIIVPFFKEGGRLTVNNVHYVENGSNLIPAGETEFSKDRTFGFRSSHLGEWIEEKTDGLYKKEETTYITLEEIRNVDLEGIMNKLLRVKDFNKVVVNALVEEDIIVFATALLMAVNQGKHFLFRTAATFTKVIGGIPSRPLLSKEELLNSTASSGGLIMIGSHVKKTTDQLNELMKLETLNFIELNSDLVLEEVLFKEEVERVREKVCALIKRGVTTVVYTKRERLDLGEGRSEEELKLSVAISDAVTSIVRNLSVRPTYIIAKGGITSSDIGTKGLCVKRATVAGQIAPGIPVWKTGKESTFPHIPYIIFPGNVGEATTLKEIVRMLEGIEAVF